MSGRFAAAAAAAAALAITACVLALGVVSVL